jgi:SAM-dependent methyltransferase
LSAETPSDIPASSKSLPSHLQGVERKQLKSDLVRFWNSQESGRNPEIDEKAANLPYRRRAAEFIPQGSRILDVACGTAANARWFLPRGDYFAIDISTGFLRLIREQGLRRICADAEALPFRDNSFDVATLTFCARTLRESRWGPQGALSHCPSPRTHHRAGVVV